MEDEVLAIAHVKIAERDHVSWRLLGNTGNNNKVAVMQVVKRHRVDRRDSHRSVVLSVALQQARNIGNHLRVRRNVPIVVRRHVRVTEASLRKLRKRNGGVEDIVLLDGIVGEFGVSDCTVRDCKRNAQILAQVRRYGARHVVRKGNRDCVLQAESPQ